MDNPGDDPDPLVLDTIYNLIVLGMVLGGLFLTVLALAWVMR